MSNELIVPTDIKTFAAFQISEQEQLELQRSIDATGDQITIKDLVQVRVPAAGGTSWIINGPGGETQDKKLTGIPVYYGKHGVLWPREDNQKGDLPVLVSHDLQTARVVGPMDDDMAAEMEKCWIDTNTYVWSETPIQIGNKTYPGNPYNQWGSGKGGKRKRCKEQRVIFLLRSNDRYPLVITIPPGSLKTMGKMNSEIMVSKRIPYYRTIIDLTLHKEVSQGGQTFAQVRYQVVGELSAEAGNEIYERCTKVFAEAAKTIIVTDQE